MSKGERYSKVSRRMWNDARFRALSSAPPNGQTLFQRLLTGPELTNIPGCFQAWEAGLAQALGWSLEGFRKAFGELFAQGLAKADWETGFIWVPKAINHNRPENPNVVKSWKATWDELPECQLKSEAFRGLKSFLEGLPKGFAEAFEEVCRNPLGNQPPNQEQEQEQDQEQEIPPNPPAGGDDDSEGEDHDDPDESEEARQKAKEQAEVVTKIFDFWKLEHGHPKAKLDRKRRSRIKARLRDQFTPREICQAIRGAKHDKFLMGENESGRVYDDIHTLLRDAAQVERLIELDGGRSVPRGPSVVSPPVEYWKPEPRKRAPKPPDAGSSAPPAESGTMPAADAREATHG